MVNASNLNLAHIGGKPVIITSKPTSGQVQQPGQSVIIQAGQANGTNFVIGGQTLKMQGNVMQNILNQNNSSGGQQTTHQTVMVGNQLVKVQSQHPQQNNVSVNSSSGGTSHPVTAKTVMLGSSGQTIKLQQSAAGGLTQNQQVILGTANKVSFFCIFFLCFSFIDFHVFLGKYEGSFNVKSTEGCVSCTGRRTNFITARFSRWCNQFKNTARIKGYSISTSKQR